MKAAVDELRQEGHKSVERSPFFDEPSIGVPYCILDNGYVMSEEPNESISVRPRGEKMPKYLGLANTIRLTPAQRKAIYDQARSVVEALSAEDERGFGSIDFVGTHVRGINLRPTDGWQELSKQHKSLTLAPLLDALAVGDDNGPVRHGPGDGPGTRQVTAKPPVGWGDVRRACFERPVSSRSPAAELSFD